MTLSNIWESAQSFCRRAAFTALFRHPVKMRNEAPLISFTFDDFPRSAYKAGGTILKTHGFRGTYYTALGLLGEKTPVGESFSREDLSNVVADGHELGCHTFGHCHAWNTAPGTFEQSIIENRRRLSGLLPEASFKTFAYPKSAPRPQVKRVAARHFASCRSGGQTYNAGVVDRCLLAGYFLEQSRHDPDSVKRMIDRSSEACGWLIFATHDVCETPTRFGCSPRFLEDVVCYAARSGARILPVGEAWDIVCGQAPSRNAATRDQWDRASIPHAGSSVAP